MAASRCCVIRSATQAPKAPATTRMPRAATTVHAPKQMGGCGRELKPNGCSGGTIASEHSGMQSTSTPYLQKGVMPLDIKRRKASRVDTK